MKFEFPAMGVKGRRVHVGVVASGDLEVLLEPREDTVSVVTITTRIEGHEATWRSVLERFFARHDKSVRIHINDFGATPGMVGLRLEQAMELCINDNDSHDNGPKTFEPR